jgi:hypothetical protein
MLITDEPGVLVRADLALPLPSLLQLAAALGRAVPDAKLIVKEDAGQSRYSLPPTPEAAPKTATAAQRALVPKKRTFDDHGLEEDDPDNPWSALDADPLTDARFEAVAAGFVDHSLDSVGRDRARALLRSTAPLELALGCRIARLTEWKSAVQPAKRCLRHGDTRVRLEAVQAVGALGGPALELAVRPLLDDTSPEVRAAAQVAVDGWA